jgi:hypothetical protein
MNEKILKIPYGAFKEDWNLLQQFLKMKGNPRYIIVGDVNLALRQDIFDLRNLVGVDGNLGLNQSSIESLGDLEYVTGFLHLYSCKNIKTLGKLKKVDGDLWLSQSSIESLGNLEFVGENLDLWRCTNIKTLGKLKRVENSLFLTKSSVKSMGALKFIGGRLFIIDANIPYSELDRVEVVGKIIEY